MGAQYPTKFVEKWTPLFTLVTLYLLTTVILGGTVAECMVSVLDSGAEGHEFKSQPRRCRVTVLGKLFTPIVPLFTKQRNW